VPLFDGYGIPCGECRQLRVDSRNGRVLPNVGQRNKTACQVVAALAVLDLLGSVEVIARDDVDGLLQQGQVAQPVLVVVVGHPRVLVGPLVAQIILWLVGQDVLDFQIGERLQTAWHLQPAERHLDVLRQPRQQVTCPVLLHRIQGEAFEGIGQFL
jgi:hypothetical protein